MLRRLVRLAAAAPLLADPIQQAFDRLYNFDFRGAHALLDQRLAERPGDPMGHSVRAAVYLFSELDLPRRETYPRSLVVIQALCRLKESQQLFA
jgi:hypothetical protein